MSIVLIVHLALAWTGDPQPRFFDPGRVGLEAGSTASEVEVYRIRRHLALVEATLREETPTDLPEAQAQARAALLDELHAYAQRGVFPVNPDFPDRRVPYFIDEFGTACAVGHLMIESGSAQLAYEIASNENNDLLADIEHPGVGPWLDAQGLTAAEAAWIQPRYGPCGFGDQPLVCGVDGNTYLCEYVATECAMVAIDHEGACGSETDSETDSETGGGEIIGEEICSGSEETDSGESSAGSSEGDASATDDTATGDAEGDGQGDGGRKGCSIGGSPVTSGFTLLMLVLVAARRRRTAAP
jgi:MYXO-CTERM domain-containing protein